MHRIAKYLNSTVASLVLMFGLVLLLSPATTSALFDGSREQVCQGANYSSATSTNCDTQAGKKASGLLADVINIISVVVGVIAVIMIMIGGVRYVTSMGDSSAVSSAKNTILYAVVGLIVVALAQVIVRFVLAKVSPDVVPPPPPPTP